MVVSFYVHYKEIVIVKKNLIHKPQNFDSCVIKEIKKFDFYQAGNFHILLVFFFRDYYD